MGDIGRLEGAFNQLLPERRLESRPGADLLSAGDHWSRAVWAAAVEAGPYPVDDGERARGLRLARQPIFVCGAHRSGTSLVRDLCDGHPQLVVLPAEGGFFTAMQTQLERLSPAEKPGFVGREWLRRLANPSNQAPYWLLGRTTEHHSPYLIFARKLMAWWSILEEDLKAAPSLQPLVAVVLAYASCLGGSGIGDRAKRWLEKTPTNERYLDRLWAEFPAARVVHVVRHPVHIYASRKMLEERFLGALRSPRQVLEDLACSFQVAVENRVQKGGREYLLVRYENLVSEPETVMGQLAAFLKIEPDPCLLVPSVAGKPAYANSSFSRDKRPGSIHPAERSNPRTHLTKREQNLVAAYTAEFALTLGYPLEVLRPGHRLWLKAQLGLVEIVSRLFRKLHRKMKRGAR
jgi:hypothetical protein